MSSLIFYNSYDIFISQSKGLIPGEKNYSSFFRIFSLNINAMDRTHTINIPLKTKILPNLLVPTLVDFKKEFSQVCDDRAIELMNLAKSTNRKLCIMYSGGIDSTTMITSFLKNCSDKDVRDNIVVLMSDMSVNENPNFFYNYISKKINYVNSYRFPYFLGNDDYIFISGENADQLFGSQATTAFVKGKSFDSLFKPLDEMQGQIIDWIKSEDNNCDAEKMYNIFRKLTDNAEVKIDTVYKFFWWINFSLKWQAVYTRILPFSKNPKGVKFEENYTTFFSTKDFQLWSMNNTDYFIKETSNSAKWIAKQYIYEYNKDQEYLKKPKMGSLTNMFRQKHMPLTIDEEMNFSYEYPSKQYYEPNNDFV